MIKKMKIIVMSVCVVIVIIFILLSFQPSSPEKVTVAIVSSLTGNLAENGVDMANGAKMALEEAKEKGIFGDSSLNIKLFDDESKPKVAVSVANRLCQDKKIKAVIGHLTSGCMLAASSVYARNDMPVVMPVPTNPKITQGDYTNLFRIPPKDDEQAPFLAKYLLSKDPSASVAIVHDLTAYGEGFAKAFRDTFLTGGGNIVSFMGAEVESKDYRTVITKLRLVGPKYIVLGATYDMGAPFIRQMKELGFNATLLSGDGCYGSEFIKLAGNAAEGTIVSFIAPDRSFSQRTEEFFQRFEQKYGKVVSFAPLGYDGGLVVVEALKKSSSFERTEIINTIRSPNFVVNGVTGKIKFDANGDNVNTNLVLYKVESGKWILLQ